MLDWLFGFFSSILVWYALIGFATMLIPQLLVSYIGKEQNLKKKYNAKWALVTGGSSGIGRAICEKLAEQGINIVIVALPDTLLDSIIEKLQAKYPDLEFRKVGVNLGEYDVMPEIEKATKDITISLVFNNAGFISTSFFADAPIEKIMANYNCNATCMVKITHFFLNKMLNQKIRGAICFTSSPSAFIPCPSSSIYGGTKAFVTEFAASIAPEVKQDGIDIMVIHPSPVDTQFYTNVSHNLDSITFFKKQGVSPQVIASSIFIGLGRVVVYDQGVFPFLFKLLLRVVEFNFFTYAVTIFGRFLGDFKKLRKERA